MIQIEINEISLLVKPNISILEASRLLGIVIPRFCYHETLSVAGNCRMCLVEVLNAKGPVASCAILVDNGIKIFTDTPAVKKARENVLELLLLNHPLDCPICDQGGECDLQDQAKAFGSDFSRFFFNKRSTEQKQFGGLIKAIMTRCIHCTRCVRYGSEIAGVEILGVLNRGVNSEIGNYLNKSFNSEISGNVIDLCPVGALTAKPYMFKARPWELKLIETLDVTDNLGSNLFVSVKDNKIVRVIPKNNSNLNNSIISDKARFSYDSLNYNRITHILKKKSNNNQDFKEIKSWGSILPELSKLTKKLILVNDETDSESLQILKILTYKYNINYKLRTVSNIKTTNYYTSWDCDKVTSLENSSLCVIIGSNLRTESAVLNSKIRTKFINKLFTVVGFSNFYNSNFKLRFINLSVNSIKLLLESKYLWFSKILNESINPLFCIGESINNRNLNLKEIKNLIVFIPTLKVFCIRNCPNYAGLSFFGIPFISSADWKNIKTTWFINLSDNFLLSKQLKLLTNKTEIVWFSYIGSNLANKATLILPICSEFEESKIFFNLEHRPQKTTKSISNVNNSRELKSISKIVGNLSLTSFKYNDFNTEILNSSMLFQKTNKIFSKNLLNNFEFSVFSCYPTKLLHENFYMSNKFTKNSKIMNNCSEESKKSFSNFTD